MVDCVSIELHPAFRPRIDANRWQEAAEIVAYDHMTRCSPEFVEYVSESLGDRIPLDTVASIISALTREAHLVQQAKGVVDCIREDFVTYVAEARDTDAWALSRKLYREVRDAA